MPGKLGGLALRGTGLTHFRLDTRMSSVATEELTNFLDYIWGPDAPLDGKQVFVYAPIEKDGDWTKYMFPWPAKKEAVVRHILKWSAMGYNVFYSPALYKATKPIKENVIGSWFLWVDFDGNAPLTWEELDTEVSIPKPSLVIQSSMPTHQHCYWKLDTFLTDIDLLEDRNRALAYFLKADTSGWDADQILRPLHSTNHKRGMPVILREANI